MPKEPVYTEVHPVARLAGFFIPPVVEAVFTYQFDIIKNIVMANPSVPKPVSSMATIMQSLRKPLTVLPTIASEAKATGQRQAQISLGPRYAAYDFSQSKEIWRATQWAHRGLLDYSIYKLGNRGMKFTAQPVMLEACMGTHAYTALADATSDTTAKTLVSGTVGGFLGFVEVAFNYWDRGKVLSQTQFMTRQEAHAIMRKEGILAQYRGWYETALRNVTGSSILFGAKYLSYAYMGVTDHNNVTFAQSFWSSTIGNVTMILGSHPYDLLKVRKQVGDAVSEATPSLWQRLRTIHQKEGVHGLTQGISHKLIGSGFKGTLIMTFSEMLVKRINQHLQTRESPRPAM